MIARRLFASLLFVVGTIGMASWAIAAEAAVTKVYVKDMHCANCAKKIASKLYTVPGVATVKTSVKANLADITAAKDKTPSPKALWEAVEKAGFKPVKIVSPDETYTSKPKS